MADNDESPSYDTLKVLILEDNPADAELMEYELSQAGFVFTSLRVETEKSYIDALEHFAPDIILSDYDLPGFSGADALQIRKSLFPNIPFILVTGAVGEERAIEILTGGATDYVLKKNLSRLIPAFRRALEESYEHRKRRQAEQERDNLLRELEKRVQERTEALQSSIKMHQQTERALRHSEERYRSLFNSIDQGFCIIKLIFNQENEAVDYNFLDFNPAFERQAGYPPVKEILPSTESFLDICGKVAISSQPIRSQQYLKAFGRWFDFYVFPVGEKEEQTVAFLFNNITEQRKTEQALRHLASINAYRVSLNDSLRKLADPSEIQYEASRVLAQQLRASRVIYCEVSEIGKLVVKKMFTQTDVFTEIVNPSMQFDLNDFDPMVLQQLMAGYTTIVSDVLDNPQLNEKQRRGWIAVQVRAHISVPLIKGGRLVAAMAAHQSIPRSWTADEVALVEETAERTWAIVERARAEAELRESELRYRSLLNSIDEGFTIFKVILDDKDKVVDVFVMDCNPAFGKQTGLPLATGKTVREVLPKIEQYLLEIAGAVLQRREPIRTETFIKELSGWYDFTVFPFGNLEGRQVAMLFTNITDRKQAEEALRINAELNAFRVALNDSLRPLADPSQIQYEAARILGVHIGANRVLYGEISEDGRIASGSAYTHCFSGSTQLPTIYDLDQDSRNQFLAGKTLVDPNLQTIPDTFGIRAHISVPLIKEGRLVAAMAAHQSEPRAWAAQEVALVEETAERTWAAVERARAEAELRKSETCYRSLFNSIDEGFAILQVLLNDQNHVVDEIFIDCNPAFEIQSSFSPAIGISVRELFPEIDQLIQDYADAILKGSEPIRRQVFIKDLGRWFDFSVFSFGRREDRTVALLFRNITERKKTEDKLRQGEERYRNLVVSSPDAILVHRNNRILFANPSAVKLVGANNLSELTAKLFMELIPDSERQVVSDRICKIMEGENNIPLREGHIIRLDGTRVPIEAMSSSVEFEGSRAIQSMLRDATARKKAEEELRQWSAKLERANRELDAFTYSVSHDLKGPLRAMQGFSNMILKDYGAFMDVELKRRFDVIRDNTKLMDDMIDALLNLSRVERTTIAVVEVNMRSFFEGVWEEIKKEYPSRKMEFKLGEAMPPIQGDPNLIRQLVYNLLSNAAKFTARRRKPLIEVGSRVEGKNTIYFVKDNGAGFDMELYDKLFGVFQRLHSKSEFSGTGIGLTLAKRIVTLHGGHIWAEGKVNKGATFFFSIPNKIHPRSDHH